MKDKAKPRSRRKYDTRGKLIITRVSLHEQVVGLVRQMIVSGALPVGEKIRVGELAQELDVSLTPLREALKVLAGEKLVELMPNRGARVAAMTVEGVQELFTVIAGIEALAAELAAERITEEEMAEIQAEHAKMALHHQRGERDEYFNLNRKIHDMIVTFAGNETLTQIRAQLSIQAERARFLSVASGTHRMEAMKDHEDLMDAFHARDSKKAHEIWRQHLISSGEETCRILRLWENEPAGDDHIPGKSELNSTG
ncbi:MAG: GntR family transcriptional regulator [Rhodobacteraceae bacterium]|nr:GntR family transcriptional regulator [Paracoccaceae bacterium]